MIELRLLGPQAVRDSDGRELSSLPAQPKRFALLAYLAIGSGSGYHRRDTLAAMFWPEMDQFAARRALRNTLYHLRDALGDGAIITRGDDAVAVDPAVITCDVAQLTDAVAGERYEDALGYYRGELLAGIHFANSGEAFEEWLSHERARITDLVMRALRALVDRHERDGNLSAAAYWAQQACGVAPVDEAWLRRSMSLLDACGDRGSALRLHELFARRLAAEFDARPSADTDALVARIRAGSSSRANPVSSSSAPVIPHESPEPESADAVVLPASAPGRLRRRLAWAGGIVGVAAAVGLAVWLAPVRHAPAPASRARVLVSVFDNRTGTSDLQVLGRMAQDWLTQGILRTQLVDVVDSRAVVMPPQGVASNPVELARRTGATMIVSGSYYRSGDSLFFQAALSDARAGRVVRVVGPIVARVDQPVAALDNLSSRVMTALAASIDLHVADEFPTSARLPSFDAYRAYVEGWDAFWHGDGKRAEELFALAGRRDTSFASAAVALAMVAANHHQCSRVDSLVRWLGAGRPALDRRDALSLRIDDAFCHGRNEETLRLTLERAELEPGTSSMRPAAAAAALWANRPLQTLAILSRMNPETDLSWTTDSTHIAYWGNLTEALHLLGHHEEELATANRVSLATPLNRAWLRGRALAALSRPTEVIALVDTALTLPAETTNNIGLAPFTDGRPEYAASAGWVAMWIARDLAVHGDSAASREIAQHAIAWYRARTPEERATYEDRLIAAWALELAGAPSDAEPLVRGLIAADSGNVDYRGALAGLAAERGDTALCDSLDRWLAAQSPDRVTWTASFYRARVAVLEGRPNDAVARVRDALDEGAWPMWLHLDPVLARLRDRRDFVALVSPRG